MMHFVFFISGGASHKRELGEFENYWARLMDFKEKHGHSNGKYYMCFVKHKCELMLTFFIVLRLLFVVPVRYKEDLKLGKWVRCATKYSS